MVCVSQVGLSDLKQRRLGHKAILPSQYGKHSDNVNADHFSQRLVLVGSRGELVDEQQSPSWEEIRYKVILPSQAKKQSHNISSIQLLGQSVFFCILYSS